MSVAMPLGHPPSADDVRADNGPALHARFPKRDDYGIAFYGPLFFRPDLRSLFLLRSIARRIQPRPGPEGLRAEPPGVVRRPPRRRNFDDANHNRRQAGSRILVYCTV